MSNMKTETKESITIGVDCALHVIRDWETFKSDADQVLPQLKSLLESVKKDLIQEKLWVGEA